MAIKVAINHRTSYNYDRLVTLSPHIIRLRPAPRFRTSVSSYAIRIHPSTHFLNWQQDPHGNYLAPPPLSDALGQLRRRETQEELAAVEYQKRFLAHAAQRVGDGTAVSTRRVAMCAHHILADLVTALLRGAGLLRALRRGLTYLLANARRADSPSRPSYRTATGRAEARGTA